MSIPINHVNRANELWSGGPMNTNSLRWSHLRFILRRAGEALLMPALTAWHLARDPETPKEAKAALFSALAYLVLPVDAVPDFLPGVGYTDDLAALTAALTLAARLVTWELLEKARASAREVFA
jgi:uncharacterized membrane protein YkvA (DUF1232 family)